MLNSQASHNIMGCDPILCHAIAFMGRENAISRFQVARHDPFTFGGIEGMIGRGFDDFAISR